METSSLLMVSEHEALPIATLILTFPSTQASSVCEGGQRTGWHHQHLCSHSASAQQICCSDAQQDRD